MIGIQTKKEKIKSLLENLNYGEFLKWIFNLLDWYPSRFLLINTVNNLDLANQNNPEVIKDNELYRFRKEVTSLLQFKDILEFVGVDYVSCCLVEQRPSSTYEYTIDSDKTFRELLKLTLGKDIEFLEYACEKLNKDIYDKAKNTRIISINSPRIKI